MQFTTLTEAISRAPGAARVLISQGHYGENYSNDKPLDLIGDGQSDDIAVERDGTTLIFDMNLAWSVN